MKIVITGGHHSSALPVIAELKRISPQAELFWFGHKYSLLGNKNPTLEYREISSLGIPFYEIKAGKVYRTFNPGRLIKIPFGFFQSLYYLLKVKPDVIASFGGYLAVPVVLAGWILGIPSVTHEQTVVSGYANKVIGIFAKKILISWPESSGYFPSEKTILTGLPLRQEIFSVYSDNFQINSSLPTVYITAGKTGSVKINEQIRLSLEKLLHHANVIHQCGDHSQYNYFDQLCAIYEDLKDKVPGKYNLRKFVYSDEIGEAYCKADLVVCRSGAHTMTELLFLKKPCLLIPIPWVSHNEQYKNAQVLVKAGLGEILEEKDLSGLEERIEQSLNNLSRFTVKNEEYSQLLRKDVPNKIADEIIKTAQKKE